jgi:Fic family protein
MKKTMRDDSINSAGQLNQELGKEAIAAIQALQDKTPLRVGQLSEGDWLAFTEAFTYDTNAIEGSTVSYAEVKDILENGTRPLGREEWEIAETHGVAKAVGEIRSSKEAVSPELILKLHRICFEGSKQFAGKFRPKGVDVCIMGRRGEILHVGAPSENVVPLLKELAEWYDKNRRKYSPLLLAAVVHNQFEDIHPFEDGNGRLGRLLLNNVLIKHGMPPVNITFKRRSLYYRALRIYQSSGDVRPMIETMISEYGRFYGRPL